MAEYSVSEVNAHIKNLLSNDHALDNICIKGEVSNCKYQNGSGHIYFTLKDASAQISCVMFASKRTYGLYFKMVDGMAVKAKGQISVYERDGKYQLYCESIEQAGKGNLYEQFEMLKKKLEEEGLFDLAHKKPIPKYVMKLGVITAKGGAAIQDIINISTRRNPHINICLYPALVQGAGSAESLIKGLHAMERVKPDCIIIGRGGGSIEDLWSFNDERLARAVYACDIPVISAVGHETDFTIIDFVSDLRAPTPSAGAELAVFDFGLFKSRLVDIHSQILSDVLNKVELSRNAILTYERRLKVSSPRGKLAMYNQRLESAKSKVSDVMTNCLKLRKSKLEGYRSIPHRIMLQKLNTSKYRLAQLEDKPADIVKYKLEQSKNKIRLDIEKLKALSPLNKLEAGYSYITDENGHNVNSVTKVKKGDKINIKMKDGDCKAEII